MLGRTHEIAAIATVLAVDAALGGIHANTPTAILCLFAALVGGLSPDLDTPTSLIYKRIPAGSIVGKIIHPVFIGGHRHISHSIIGVLIFAYLSHKLIFAGFTNVNINDYLIFWSYMIGLLSHLFFDSITKEGIPIFFPFNFTFALPPIKAFRIRTGSIIEHLGVVPFLIITIAYIFIHYNYIFFK